MPCDRSDKCRYYRTKNDCIGCSYKHIIKRTKITEKDSLLTKLSKKTIEEHCFAKSNKRSTGGRYRMDEPLEKLFLQEVKKLDPAFPSLRKVEKGKLNVFLKGKGKDIWKLSAKFDVALETRKRKLILVEVKGYGSDSNSIYSAILAAKILRMQEDRRLRNALFYYFSMEPREKLRSDRAHERKSLIDWAESIGIVDGFFGIQNMDSLVNHIKTHT